MRYALYTLILGASSLALAQNRPQLTWEGYVAGSAVLYVQGDRVDVQGRDTGAVERPRFQFVSPLPAARQRVEMDVRRGRGRVEILEQPTPANEYSLVVRIDPSGNRHEQYALDFFWDASDNSGYNNDPYSNRGPRARRNDGGQTRGRTNDRMGPGEMVWNGTVDQEAVIEIRGRRAVARTLRGRPVSGDRAEFSSPMPRSAMVRLEDVQGRGRIELVQQPGDNGNVAAVRILDEEGGAGQYSFRLVWDDASGGYYGSSTTNDPNYRGQQGVQGVLTPDAGSGNTGYGNSGYGNSGSGGNVMRWSGRVDGRVRVSVQGDRAWSTRVQGQPVAGEQVSFGTPLPRRGMSDVSLRKLQGRDDVEIIQQPSASNGYTLIFEIDDEDSGADDYVVEINWR